jgi:hypothetical protein
MDAYLAGSAPAHSPPRPWGHFSGGHHGVLDVDVLEIRRKQGVTARLIRNGVWSDVRVVANKTTAIIYVNGRAVSQAAVAKGTTALTGVQLASGGTPAVGDDVQIDNFLLR